jgi:hypothetical protein
MDINKVQQLNDMAHTLKMHNMGYSAETMVHEAENIYGHEDYSKGSKEAVTMEQNDYDEMRKDVRKLTYGMQTMINEFKEMKAKVEQMEKELNDVRVGQVPRRSGQQVLTNDEEAPRRNITKPIDRNNVAPADVSVEKFFYFGK